MADTDKLSEVLNEYRASQPTPAITMTALMKLPQGIRDLLAAASSGSVSADKGDAAATLTVGVSEATSIWATAITADRAVALSTTGARNGDRLRIVRTASATGAFDLNVGTGPLKAMDTAGSFCDVEYNGSAWVLTAYGVL